MSCIPSLLPVVDGPTLWELKSLVEEQYPDFPQIDVNAPDFSEQSYISSLMDLYNAMEVPHTDITVTWKDLTCSVPIESSAGSLTGISETFKNARDSIQNGGAKVSRTESQHTSHSVSLSTKQDDRGQKSANVLDKVFGIIEPGTMCLVLGPSGSGSSLLLSRLASRELGSKVHSSGQVLYSGDEKLLGIIKPVHFLQYVGQFDNHIPQITVRQTLEFAAECKWPEWFPHVEAVRRNDVIITARLLRIERTLDTIVGDNVLRGVSGGERKRCTIAEMIIGMSAGFVIMDNWSKGLDSQTTLSITKSMRRIASYAKTPIITSMQAPGSDTFKLFDTVCVLDQGRVIYFGPREKAEDWFLGLGFTRPPQRSVPDFLATVANPDMRKEYLPADTDLSNLEEDPPFTSEEFAARFASSSIAEKVHESIEEASAMKSELNPMVPGVFREAAEKDSLQKPKHQIRAIGRLYLRYYGAIRKNIFNELFENLIMGLILGSVFWQLPKSSGGATSRAGLIFLAMLFVGLAPLAKVAEKHEAKIVFAKQRYAAFYEAWPYILTLTLFEMVIELLRAIVFVVPLYTMSGLNLGDSAQRLIYAVVLEMILALVMIGLMRFVIAFSDDADSAQGVSGIVVILLLLFCGYMKPPGDLDSWLKWIYWINPLHYVFEALTLNEFDGLDLKCELEEFRPPGLAQLGVSTELLDCPVSTGREFIKERFDVTNGEIFRLYFFLVLVGYVLLATLIGAIATALAKPKGHALRVRNIDDVINLEQNTDLEATTVDMTSEPFAGQPNTFLTFSNVKYSVDNGSKTLLNGINGYAVSGKVVLLMGESGAGKSTLLDVCALRKTMKKGTSVEGNIRLNGTDISKKIISTLTGYCEQNDLHIKEATVKEAVYFSAKLRLPETIPVAEKNVRAIETMDLLGLTPFSDMLVKSLGSGELKLLTMAVEVVAAPKVLFLDEPTSGISAASALIVANALRKIADTGTCVICTVHQPSKEVFGMFDQLLLLKRGGQQVYFGDIGVGGAKLRAYFEERGAMPMDEDTNPADWMLDVIADESRDYAEEWNQSAELKELQEEVHQMEQPRAEEARILNEPFKRVSSLVQMSEVMKRLFWRYWRMPEYNFTRVILMLSIALLSGLLFLRDIDNTQQGATFAFAALFLTVVPSSLISQNVVQPTADGRAVFYREIVSTYKPFAFHFALGVVEIPFTAVASIAFTVVFYFMVGLDPGRFWYFLLAGQLLHYFSVALGIVLSSITPNAPLALTIVGSITSVYNVLSGFFIRKDALPSYWKWFTWINPFFYYLAGVLQNQLEDRDFTCKPSELRQFTLPPNFGSCQEINPSFTPVEEGLKCSFCPIPSGDALIEAFGADSVNKWVALAALLVSIMICRVIAGIGFAKLRFLNR